MSTANHRPPVPKPTLGVTILELMVVLVVIGVLSGLAVVKFNTFQRQAELRSSAQKIFQIMNWARLESEKRGDTLLVRLSALPEIEVYVDQNGDSIINPNEPRILMDSLARSVRVFTPAATPPPANPVASGGLADGPVNGCGSRKCCDYYAASKSGSGVPSWNVPISANAGIAICARNLPRMPSDLEDGAIYLESSEAKVEEKWAMVMSRDASKNPTLWTSAKSPTDRTDWSQKR